MSSKAARTIVHVHRANAIFNLESKARIQESGLPLWIITIPQPNQDLSSSSWEQMTHNRKEGQWENPVTQLHPPLVIWIPGGNTWSGRLVLVGRKRWLVQMETMWRVLSLTDCENRVDITTDPQMFPSSRHYTFTRRSEASLLRFKAKKARRPKGSPC